MPSLTWLGIRPGPSPCHVGVLKVPSCEEGVLKARQPVGLEAEPRDRGLPITWSRIWGPIKQTNKTLLLLAHFKIWLTIGKEITIKVCWSVLKIAPLVGIQKCLYQSWMDSTVFRVSIKKFYFTYWHIWQCYNDLKYLICTFNPSFCHIRMLQNLPESSWSLRESLISLYKITEF